MPRQYIRISLEERFNANTDRSGGPTACWLWQGSKYSNGYGRVWDGEKMRLAHRVAYAVAYGSESIPEGIDVLHNCQPGPDRKDCVNPAHLWLGTQRDNARDAVQKGQITYYSGPDHPMFGVERDVCAKGHPLTTDNIVLTNRGKARRCRICYLASSHAGSLRYIDAHRTEINARKRERRDSTRTGPAIGERHGLTTLTEANVRDIRSLSKATTFRSLAIEYGVTPVTVANIVNRKTWKHVD